VSEIIENIEGARNSQDDIIIWADTQKKLTERTKEVLDATFLGHILSASGISPDPSKVEAISSMPSPKNKPDLQIPHVSEVTTPLRSLIEKTQSGNSMSLINYHSTESKN